jgi:hypothetical protein
MVNVSYASTMSACSEGEISQLTLNNKSGMYSDAITPFASSKHLTSIDQYYYNAIICVHSSLFGNVYFLK